MKDYIGLFPNEYEELMNDDLLLGTNDTPIEDFIIMAMRELEAIENVHIEKIQIVNDQDAIDLNRHMININYKKRDVESIEIPKFKFMASSSYKEIIFTIRISTNLHEKVIEKRILVPVELDGYYINGGKRLKTIWQIVDASTYSQRGKSTIKSRMPIIIYQTRNRMIEDVNGDTFVMPSYSYALETKSKRPTAKKKTKFINPLMIYASKMGIKNALGFFGMGNIISITGQMEDKDLKTHYIFAVNELFVKVPIDLYDKYDMVKAVVCMCCNLASRDYPLAMKHLEDTEYWICRIGSIGSIKNKNILTFREKGITTLYMIERLLDTTTINNLRLPMYYKQNIYYLLYWIITNFNELRVRSNIDMGNKRIRRNEYIVNGTLGRKINENINKLIERRSKSKLNTMDTLLELFNFSSDIVLSGMRNINDLVKADDIVNDNDMIMNMAYSYKGVNSLGENGSKMISAKYRYLDPSMAGVLDLNTSSNSDVGMSGCLSPTAELYDRFYFVPGGEPCQNRYLLDKALKEDEKMKLAPDVSSFEKYVAWMSKHDPYTKAVAYEVIEIVEKDDGGK